MSKPHPLVERIKVQRAELGARISGIEADLAAAKAELAMLDRLTMPAEAAKPAEPPKPRTSRKVKVTEHERNLDAPDPGPALPGTEPPA